MKEVRERCTLHTAHSTVQQTGSRQIEEGRELTGELFVDMRSNASGAPANAGRTLHCLFQKDTNSFFWCLENARRRVGRVSTVDPVRVDSPVRSFEKVRIILIPALNLNLTIYSVVAIRLGERNRKREGSPLDGSIVIAVGTCDDSLLDDEPRNKRYEKIAKRRKEEKKCEQQIEEKGDEEVEAQRN